MKRLLSSLVVLIALLTSCGPREVKVCGPVVNKYILTPKYTEYHIVLYSTKHLKNVDIEVTATSYANIEITTTHCFNVYEYTLK